MSDLPELERVLGIVDDDGHDHDAHMERLTKAHQILSLENRILTEVLHTKMIRFEADDLGPRALPAGPLELEP